MKKVKVYIEISEYGFSAYMDDTPLNYGCIGEGKTVRETMDDFNDAYREMREYYASEGMKFEEIEYEFHYDIASFLQSYAKDFGLAGLERITGVNQTMLGHYLHGRRKPSGKTIEKIEKSIIEFGKDLAAIRFA